VRLIVQILGRCNRSHLLLVGLHDECLVDVGDDTTTGDGSLDEGIKLLVTADSQLEMSGSDALDLQVFAGDTGQLEDLGGEVLKDSGGVNSGGSTDTGVSADSALQESVDTAHGELHSHDHN
jgi:hypothetical protein